MSARLFRPSSGAWEGRPRGSEGTQHDVESNGWPMAGPKCRRRSRPRGPEARIRNPTLAPPLSRRSAAPLQLRWQLRSFPVLWPSRGQSRLFNLGGAGRTRPTFWTCLGSVLANVESDRCGQTRCGTISARTWTILAQIRPTLGDLDRIVPKSAQI